MTDVIQVLVRIRDELDALIVGLSTVEEEKPIEVEPVAEGECEHKVTQVITGAGQSVERIACADCGKEL